MDVDEEEDGDKKIWEKIDLREQNWTERMLVMDSFGGSIERWRDFEDKTVGESSILGVLLDSNDKTYWGPFFNLISYSKILGNPKTL